MENMRWILKSPYKGYWRMSPNSMVVKEMNNAIIKTQSEIGQLNAQEALTTEKARGYYQELLNATKSANSEEVKAIAIKLAAEHSTGEYTNWKTWVDMAEKGIGMAADIVKMAM